MLLDDNLDDFPDISISEATTDMIKGGEAFARYCRKNAQVALEMAERAEQYAELFRRLATAYAKAAKQAIEDVGEAISMEWDLTPEEEVAETKEEDET